MCQKSSQTDSSTYHRKCGHVFSFEHSVRVYAYILLLQKYNDAYFRRFYPPQSRLKPSLGMFPRTYGMEVGLLDGEKLHA